MNTKHVETADTRTIRKVCAAVLENVRRASVRKSKRAQAQLALDLLTGAAIFADQAGEKAVCNRLCIIGLSVAGAADVARLETFANPRE